MVKGFDPNRQHLRGQVAHLAAKLMAEDGIVDFAFAKRKAARQLGVTDTGCLPGNAEIDLALRQYQAIYQETEQHQRVMALRQHALAVMKRLERYDPRLFGSVLGGTAGRYAAIDVALFADSDKEVELFLLAQQIVYERGEKRLRFGEMIRMAPTFILDDGPAPVEAIVLMREDLRTPPRSAVDGKVLAWARPQQVERLLAGEMANSPEGKKIIHNIDSAVE